MGRPKTVAMLREQVLETGEVAVTRLKQFAQADDGGDPRMAAVIERACEALLDRIGLTPNAAEKLAEKPSPPAPPPTRDSTEADLLAAATTGEA